jgi:hypothetical protein
VFFWSNENDEPVHIHVSVGKVSPNSTKIWLTENGGCIAANNKSKIAQTDLNKIMDVICDKHADICEQWKDFFDTDEIFFYC